MLQCFDLFPVVTMISKFQCPRITILVHTDSTAIAKASYDQRYYHAVRVGCSTSLILAHHHKNQEVSHLGTVSL